MTVVNRIATSRTPTDWIGGVRTATATAVGWTTRFIRVTGSDLFEDSGGGAGWRQIPMPANGTVIPKRRQPPGGGNPVPWPAPATVTVAGGLIPLANWETLWAVLTPGDAATGAVTFLITDIDDWFAPSESTVPIAVRNADTAEVHWLIDGRVGGCTPACPVQITMPVNYTSPNVPAQLGQLFHAPTTVPTTIFVDMPSGADRPRDYYAIVEISAPAAAVLAAGPADITVKMGNGHADGVVFVRSPLAHPIDGAPNVSGSLITLRHTDAFGINSGEAVTLRYDTAKTMWKVI